MEERNKTKCLVDGFCNSVNAASEQPFFFFPLIFCGFFFSSLIYLVRRDARHLFCFSLALCAWKALNRPFSISLYFYHMYGVCCWCSAINLSNVSILHIYLTCIFCKVDCVLSFLVHWAIFSHEKIMLLCVILAHVGSLLSNASILHIYYILILHLFARVNDYYHPWCTAQYSLMKGSCLPALYWMKAAAPLPGYYWRPLVLINSWCRISDQHCELSLQPRNDAMTWNCNALRIAHLWSVP